MRTKQSEGGTVKKKITFYQLRHKEMNIQCFFFVVAVFSYNFCSLCNFPNGFILCSNFFPQSKWELGALRLTHSNNKINQYKNNQTIINIIKNAITQ